MKLANSVLGTLNIKFAGMDAKVRVLDTRVKEAEEKMQTSYEKLTKEMKPCPGNSP